MLIKDDIPMLTKQQQEIIIQTMKPYDPIRIAYNAFDSEKDRIELLYEFNKRVSLMDSSHIILDLEDAFGCDVNIVHYDCISPYGKDWVLEEAVTFFHEREIDKEVSSSM